MITEQDVKWDCKSCLHNDNCLHRRTTNDQPDHCYRPNGRYIQLELERLNEIECERLEEEENKKMGIKPCPFCGGKAKISKLPEDYGYHPAYYIVVCKDDTCRGFSYPNCGDSPTKEDAVDRWNRRVS